MTEKVFVKLWDGHGWCLNKCSWSSASQDWNRGSDRPRNNLRPLSLNAPSVPRTGECCRWRSPWDAMLSRQTGFKPSFYENIIERIKQVDFLAVVHPSRSQPISVKGTPDCFLLICWNLFMLGRIHRLHRCSIRSWLLPLSHIWKDIQQGHCEGPARLESKKWWRLRNSAKASYIESSSRRRPHSSDHFCNCLCQTRQSHDDALFQAKGSTS